MGARDAVADEAGGGRLSRSAAAFLTFLAAASVLVLEIAAGRLLAPYVGVSLTTYTGIIGVILAGIAAGAWLGGRAADRVKPERLLGPTFVVGGLTAISAVPIVSLVGGADLGAGVAEIVLLATVGFVAPATVLSAVAPMIVRATLSDLATSGSIVGRLSAVGTVGAITGTFLTGFVLLGLVPTRSLIVGTGALLVVVGLVLARRFIRSPSAVVVALAACLVLAPAAAASPTPCDMESAYYCIAVVEDPVRPGGRTLVLDGLSHAYVDVEDVSFLGFGYVRRFADVAAGPVEQRGGDVDALHIGGGGFSFPRYLEATYARSRHTVLELDPRVLDVARARLAFRPSDRIRVVLGDARLSLGGLPEDGFDLVFGDAFGGLAVPWHLTTRELLAQIDRVLRPGGLYVMNIIDYPPLGFVRAEAATASTVFGHVAVVADPTDLAAGGNFVVVASHEPLDVTEVRRRISARGEAATILSGQARLVDFVGDAPVLTDDFAPVDQLLGR